MPNPFGTTFESLESPAGSVVESVHEAPYRRLIELIDSGEGQLISLRAPRAGYGKTMLLSRLREKKKSLMTIIPIHLADGRRVEGERVLEEILTQLAESVPGAAGLTKLDLHARRLFAHGLLPMVYSGEVPSQDKEGALSSLRERPTEAFDFHNDGAAIAQWTKSQYEVLAPRLSSVLGKASGASSRDTSYWITRLFEFAIRTPNEPSRTGDLIDIVFGRESRFRSGAGFLDGLGSFLNLITLVEPAVLVLDEVDGLSSDSDSALRATSSLISLWESAPRTSVIISVNDDVWESAFAPRLPLGLRDRLEDVVIRLKPLTTEEARALVKGRSGEDSVEVLKQLDLTSDSLYPRGVLKAAREAWDQRDSSEVSVKVESETKSVPIVSEKSLPDFSAAQITKTETKKEEAPAEEVTPKPQPQSKPKSNYPPVVVRRAAIPRAFDVTRIRPPAPVSPDFSAPAVAASAVPLPIQEVVAPVAPSPSVQAAEAAPEQVSSFEAAPAQAVSAEAAPEQTSHFDVAPVQAVSVEAAPVQASPFDVAAVEAAPVQASPFDVAAVEAAPVQASPFDVAAVEAAPVQASPFDVAAVEAAPVQASPFDLAAVQAAPVQASPFDVAAVEAAPVQASPFDVAAVEAAPVQARTFAAVAQVPAAPVQASPFEASAAQVPPPVTSPFHLAEQKAPESQSILPPARQTQSSPFEASQAPVAAPEINSADQPGASPLEVEPEIPERRSGRSYPSKSPFDPALAQIAAAPVAPVTHAPAPIQAPSPFAANLAPQSVPPQPEVQKADSDAIDDLLRQFREHRDS